jgi:predicted amidohydrolase
VFRLALIQMQVEGGAKQANLARAERHIAAARHAGADVVLLPEALNLGWTHGAARTEADAIPDGESCTRLRAAAAARSVFICAGLIERDRANVFNSAVLISPDGEVLLHHRKLNELSLAQDLYAQGDRLAVASTPHGKFGLMICADGFAEGQVISRTLGLMGADVILSPCAWAVPADHDNAREPYGQLWLDNYQPVARDFQLWIAGCSNVGPITDGPWQGRKCIGNSLVVDPRGDIASRAPYGIDAEAIVTVDVVTAPPPARIVT